ncbi:MAG: CofH family radical SAM protein [Rikenellaceae bacterium]
MIDEIKSKIKSGERINIEEAISLYKEAELFELSELALFVKRKNSGDYIFYNKNFHIEPTNICRFHCRFCSYRKDATDVGARDMSLNDIVKYIKDHYYKGITEVHLVGGVHPNYTIHNYCDMIRTVRENVPSEVAIKAFSAIEHIAVIEQAGLSYKEGLSMMKEAGMNSITGGGAEILDDTLRKDICPDKPMSQKWLDLHHAAHDLGIKTGATMLYGHCETLQQRIEHMGTIRDLQDTTHGFSSFIPLKYRSQNNNMSEIGECSIIEDLRTLAISRIFLDNVPHIKAYTPMYGMLISQMALLFGGDDLDGTVMATTDIYSSAGVETCSNTEEKLKEMISEIGFQAVERDTYYQAI